MLNSQETLACCISAGYLTVSTKSRCARTSRSSVMSPGYDCRATKRCVLIPSFVFAVTYAKPQPTPDWKAEALRLRRVRLVLGRTDRRGDDGQLPAHGLHPHMQGHSQRPSTPRALGRREPQVETRPARPRGACCTQQGTPPSVFTPRLLFPIANHREWRTIC